MPDLDFPRAIDTIGPERLTRKLQGSGALPAGGRVARIVAEPLGLALFHAWAERALALFEDVDGAAIIP